MAKKILCVDDEPEIRSLFKDELEERGHIVLEASNGNEAYETYQSNDVDCVISDIRMPGGDGVEFVKKVKGDDEALAVPFFFMTGFSDYTSEELMGLGVKAVIFKPFDLEEVIEMLCQVVENN